MQHRINQFLNRPFPIFFSNSKGTLYYFGMILIFVVLVNITEPFGIINWHEYHKSLIITFYIGLFFGVYALVHLLFSFLCPRNYNTFTWKIKNECRILLFFFPTITCGTCLYVNFTVPDFELTVDSMLDVLLYNSTLSCLSIPTFGFFIDKKFKSIPPPVPSFHSKHTLETVPPFGSMLPVPPKDSTKSKSHLTEEQALNIIARLHVLMETDQLYLSKKCNEVQVSLISNFAVHHISEALNTYNHKNFSEFISEYRCKHACELLVRKDLQQLTIEAIGEQCGFNNRVSFHNAFKKIYNLSPSEYQNSRYSRINDEKNGSSI